MDTNKVKIKSTTINLVHKSSKFRFIKNIDMVANGDLCLDEQVIYNLLPDNMVINGNVSMVNATIISLPNNLTINGDVDLTGANIIALPNGFKVTGNLNLSGTGLRIPTSLY